MARRRTAMNAKKPQNLLSMTLISLIVIMLIVALKVNCARLEEKKATLVSRQNYLTEQIKKEEQRTEEIEAYRQYTQTLKYVEDIAKERLGLGYPDEIIFEAQD